MADEGGVGVGVHALVPGHSRRGRGQVRGAVSPTPRVGGGGECHGDLATEHRHYMGLGRVGSCHDGGDVLVRVRRPGGALVQASTVSVDDCGSQVEDVASGGDAAGVLIGVSLGVCRKRAVIDSVVVGNRGAVRSLVHIHVLTTRSLPVCLRSGTCI